MDNFNLKRFLVENKLTENSRLEEIKAIPGNTGIKNNIIGWRWKSQQMRRDNVEEALVIIGLGPNQSRLYNSYPIEGKRVAFYDSSDPNSACEKLKKAGKLNKWFEPVYK